MKTTDFNSYKTRYRNTIRQVLAQAESGRLDEAAFPAYSHRNPIINWLFWQRLRKVMEHIQRRVVQRFGVRLEPEVRLFGERWDQA